MRYDVEVTAPEGSSITISPARFALHAGQSVELEITIEATGEPEQKFGEIRLVSRDGGLPTLHLPVAFVPQQSADLVLTQSCTPDEIARRATSECTITATNNAFTDTEVDLLTRVNRNLSIVRATPPASVIGGEAVALDQVLAGSEPGTRSIGPGRLFGYLPLNAFGIQPIPIGNEEILNFNVPAYIFAGKTHTAIGVDSNGYLVADGGTAEDNNCCDPAIPDPARPNGVLAPFWTDLDGTGAPGILAGELRSGANRWLVFEWRVNVFGTTSRRVFQTWIGLNGTEDITFAYNPANLPADPNGQPFVVGAENELGTDGDTLDPGVLPTQDLRVVSSDPVPGGSVSYSVVVRGERVGQGVVTTEMVSPAVSGTTVVTSTIEVIRR